MMTLFASSVLLLLTPLTCSAPVEIVLSRCTEDTTWVDELGYGAITTSYDKCGNAAGPGRHITKPNIGREGGTFLAHIVDRYDTLADWTVFSQAERPTYGYRGHARGGGHLMNNVKFEDYVLAAKDRFEQPRFFVFTGVVVMGKEDLFQSLRRHYGEEFRAPSPNSNRMCGQSADWFTGWMKFPLWFKEMIKQLMKEQGVRVSAVTPPELLPFFKVDVDYGVAFFAQGARFAVSKDAILSRPKSYYEDLLRLMSHPDPWAGYFLEWLWFYVLQGSTSPCGFEESLLHSFHAWLQTPARHVEIQQISGEPEPEPLILEGDVTVPLNPAEPNLVPECNADVIMKAGSTITVTSATAAQSSVQPSPGDCGASSLVIENGVRLTIQIVFEISMPPRNEGGMIVTLDGPNSGFNLGSGSTGGVFFGLIISAVNNGGVMRLFTTVLRFQNSRFRCLKRVGGQANTGRRTDFTTATYCGAELTDLTVEAGGAIEFEGESEGANCVLEDNTQYSSSVNELTHNGDSTILVAKRVSSESLPVFIELWNEPTNMPVTVETADTATSFRRDIVVYGNGGNDCPIEWTAPLTTDNCPAGMICTISPLSSDNECTLSYSQTFTAPDLIISGVGNVGGNLVPECNSNVIFRPNSVTIFDIAAAEQSTIEASAGDCRDTVMITEMPATITNERVLNVLMPLNSNGLTLTNRGDRSRFNLGPAAGGRFISGRFLGLIVTCEENGGPIAVIGNTEMDFEDSSFRCLHIVGNPANDGRRTVEGFATAKYCNVDINDGLTVLSNGAIEFLENCTSSQNNAYSNTVNELTHEGDNTRFVAQQVSPESRPAFIQLWNDPTNMPVTVETADTATSYSRNIVIYGNGDAACPTAWNAPRNVVNCPAGADCAITTSVSDTNAEECLLVYSQVMPSPVPTAPAEVDDGGSDKGLYGLLALLALIPLLACAAAGWWYWNNRSIEGPAQLQQPELYEYYHPVQASATPMDTGMYPAGYNALYGGTVGGRHLPPTPM